MANRLAPSPPKRTRTSSLAPSAGPGPNVAKPPPPPDLVEPPSWEAMYGLAGKPFEGGGPFMQFASHRRVLEQVVQHVVSGSGFLLLLGEAGIGKSMLLEAAAEAAIQSGMPAARIIRTEGDGRLPDDDTVVTNPAVSRPDPGRWAVLIDHADPRALSSLKADIEASGASVAVVAAIAAEDNVGGGLQQAWPWVRLPPVTQPELQAYVERRLWVSGGATRRLILPEALSMVMQQARGNPGTANRLMEAVLTTGFIRGEPVVTRRTVVAALGTAPRQRSAAFVMPDWVFPTVSAAIFALGLSVFLYRAFETPEQPTPAPAAQVSPRSAAAQQSASAAMLRGQQALALGDVKAARADFEQAAQSGDAAAALAAGKTYDPNFLPNSAGSDLADPNKAVRWYRRAQGLGDPEAPARLSNLLRRAP